MKKYHFYFLLQSESGNLCFASRSGLISKATEETKNTAAGAAAGAAGAAAAATAAAAAAATANQQKSNNTASPAPSPISLTPNSPKLSSPTPSLMFRSREASSDGSISPCKPHVKPLQKLF